MMQAMIFAAGLGTRLKPITDNIPKAMVEVGGMPLLRRTIGNLKMAGAVRQVVNVHHFASQITGYLRDNNYFDTDIRVSDETTGLLDTGGGIKKAAPLFIPDMPILIHNVDILSNVDLRQFYSCIGGCDALLLVSNRKTTRYLLFDSRMKLVGWTNTATNQVKTPYPWLKIEDCRMLAFAGIHVMSARMLPMMNVFPDVFGIVDFYLKMCDKADIRGYLKDDLRLMDVGKLDSLQHADRFLKSLDGKANSEKQNI